MTDRDEDLIKTRAYALWEAEGKPDGRHDAHWEQARQEFSESKNTAVLGEENAEKDGPSADATPPEPAPPEPKAPLSVIDGGAAGEPVTKRKRKTI